MLKSYSPEERAWILYDVANSAFALIVMTTVAPIFFKDIAAAGMDPADSTAWWGYANAIAALLLAVAAPLLGTWADYPGHKKGLLLLFLALGVGFTLALSRVGPGDTLLCLALYLFARLGFAGGNLFYDALLVDVSAPGRRDRVSTAGFGWGYLGSVIPFLAVIGWVFALREEGDGAISAAAADAAFVITALWWLVFSLPLLKQVHQRHGIEPGGHRLRAACSRLVRTLGHISTHRPAFLFLVAYFLYIDGVDTVITMAVVYGRDAGLGATELILAILVIQLVAFPCTLLYGRLAERTSARTLLFAGIGVYALITLLAFLLPGLADPATRQRLFWLLALLVASSQGGIQALSRSYFSRLIPQDQAAQFFGLYNVFGKFAVILGPLLIGLIGQATGDARWGMLSLLLLFGGGAWLLGRVEEAG